jgi:hypothetical protein
MNEQITWLYLLNSISMIGPVDIGSNDLPFRDALSVKITLLFDLSPS